MSGAFRARDVNSGLVMTQSFVHRTHHEASAPPLSPHQAVKARTPPPCSYLTEGALKVVFQKSIPAQIRQLILGWLELEQWARVSCTATITRSYLSFIFLFGMIFGGPCSVGNLDLVDNFSPGSQVFWVNS